MTRALHPADLWPGIKAHFGKAYKQMEKQYTRYFDDKSSDKAYEEFVESTTFGLPDVKNEGQSIRFDTDSEGYKTRMTNVVYGLGWMASREEIEDNQYESRAARRSRNLAYSMAQSKEIIHAAHFNNGFSGSYVGGDAVAFFSTAHPTFAGNKANKPTVDADLSEAALEDMLIDIRLMTNSRGLKMYFRGRELVVPPQLSFVAERLLKSEKQSGTANNDINAVRSSGMLSKGYSVWDYLTDPKAWFLMVDNVPEGLVTLQRRKLEMDQDNDWDTENAKAKATERYVSGWVDWRCSWGNQGS
jgi:phage major head subunit gpT-like protein